MSELIKHENNQAIFNVDIAWEDFKAATKKAYNKEKNKYRVPGFRKGKAPQNIIEKQYGEGVFYEDAINVLFSEVYPKALDELKLNPVDRPDLDIKTLEKGQTVVLEFKVTTKPEVELGEYLGLTAKIAKPEVSDELIDQELAKEQNMNARMVTVEDRAAENGDTVIMDYKGSIDGEYFMGGSAENTHLELGSGKFIPGFEEQLIGAHTGDELKVEVRFPDDYGSEELAGKDAIFEVTLHEIKVKDLPEIDDDFIKDISEFDSLEEYKTAKRAELMEQAEKNYDMQLRELLLQQAVDNALVDVPPVMVDHEIEHMLNDMRQQISVYGLSLEDYCRMNKLTVEELREQMREDAESRVKTSLVLEAIVKAEEIEVSMDDVEEELKKFAESENKPLDEMKKMFEYNDFKSIKDYLAPKKAINILLEHAEVIND